MNEIYRKRIPGGPDVVGYPLPGRTISAGVLVDGGVVHEPVPLAGLSHVLSQTVFQRTGRHSPQDLQLALEESGLQRDRALNPEWTRYWVRGRSADLTRALPLLADCVLAPGLDPDDVDAAKARAQGQLRRRREQHELYVTDLLRRAGFPGHPLGRPTLGTSAGIDRLSAADLRAFHAQRYRPHRMVLAVSGEFDWHEVLDLAASELSPTPPCGRPRAPRAGGPAAGGPGSAAAAGPRGVALSSGVAGEVWPVARQHVGMALPGPGYGDPDFYTWALITHILGWGYSARLFRTVRERLGLTYAVAARLVAHTGTGYVLLYGTTTPDRAGAFVTAVRETVRTLAEQGVPAGELAAAKVALASELLMRGESTAARMHTALTSAFLEPQIRGIEQIRAAIEQVGPDDVERALSAWRGEPALALATIGPIPGEELYGHVQHAVAAG